MSKGAREQKLLSLELPRTLTRVLGVRGNPREGVGVVAT